MELAHILPPRVLSLVPQYVGDYSLILPTYWREQEYRHFYRGREGFAILDNGIAEGSATSLPHLISMGLALDAQELVLPDVIGDMDATLEAIGKSYWDIFNARKSFKLMIVAQGKNAHECVSTVERAMNMFPGVVTTVGIPRHILNQGLDTRLKIAECIRVFAPLIDIHLLGTHTFHPQELKELRQGYKALKIRGVDTSLAWNATAANRDLSRATHIPRQTPEQFAKAQVSGTLQLELLQRNMTTLRKWAA